MYSTVEFQPNSLNLMKPHWYTNGFRSVSSNNLDKIMFWYLYKHNTQPTYMIAYYKGTLADFDYLSSQWNPFVLSYLVHKIRPSLILEVYQTVIQF